LLLHFCEGNHQKFNVKLNSKIQFDNVKDRWNNFMKIVCEVADGVLGKKVRNSYRGISENDLYFLERGGMNFKLLMIWKK